MNDYDERLGFYLERVGLEGNAWSSAVSKDILVCIGFIVLFVIAAGFVGLLIVLF